MRMALKDEQTGKNKHFINSLEFAWQGIKTVFRENEYAQTCSVWCHGHCIWFLVFLNTC